MRTKTAVLLFAAAALACRGRSGPAQRAQQQYDVVQEGQTTSATSSVGAPGEAQPPVTTATNTDTTGSFTLGTAPAPANMPGGPATGVLPPQQPGAMASSGMPPMGSAPAPPPRPVTIVRTPSQSPVLTNTQAPPPPTTERRPPPVNTTTSSDTAATSTTDTTASTDTTATTDTTSTEDKPKKNDKKKDNAGHKTDTSAPPPTQTDTIGGH
jgi:hypothetical protein